MNTSNKYATPFFQLFISATGRISVLGIVLGVCGCSELRVLYIACTIRIVPGTRFPFGMLTWNPGDVASWKGGGIITTRLPHCIWYYSEYLYCCIPLWNRMGFDDVCLNISLRRIVSIVTWISWWRHCTDVRTQKQRVCATKVKVWSGGALNSILMLHRCCCYLLLQDL